jgi:hypothetical protein
MAGENDWWVRLYRLGFGALGLGTVIYLLAKSESRVNFFSFFTIQSNIIAALVLLAGAILLPASTRHWDLIRGGAAIYMILTGVVYNTLLTDVDTLQTSDPWANNVVHRIVPVVMLVDFLLVPLAHRIRWREALAWTVYPVLYLAYTLIRGPIVDWYPYPFLDPREDGGYPGVVLTCVLIMIGFVAVIWLMTEVNAWRQRHRPPVAQPQQA